jgi:hypothetical protein
MLGSSLLAFSAAGAAVVGIFKDDKVIHGSDPDGNGAVKVASKGARAGTQRVEVLDNVSLAMTDSQYRRFTKLTTGDVDEHQLELFLLEFLPPSLAEKIHFALVAGLDTLPAPVANEVIAAAHEIETTREDASQPANDEQKGSASDDSDPQPTPTPSDSQASDEESPSPDQSPDDGDGITLFEEDDDEG